MYGRGCRCTECRAGNAKRARDRRRRMAEGRPSPYELVPNDAAVAAVKRLREMGMLWIGIADLVGTDPRDLQRLLRSPGGSVQLRMNDAILATERMVLANPALLSRRRRMHSEVPRARWMVSCLLARGWTSDWIASQIGWTDRLSSSTFVGTLVSGDLLGRIEGVWKAYHMVWGPSELGMLRAWRSGKFLSDCYEWDTDFPDWRPIPGSFAPDLVERAAKFRHDQSRRKPTLHQLHTVWGQWETQKCAAAAMQTWSGVPAGEVVCRSARHRHDRLPEVWQE